MPYTNPEMLCLYSLPYFHPQNFFSLFHGLMCWAIQFFQNVHRRSDVSRSDGKFRLACMAGNSSNFTDANRRVSQPRSRLFDRGADRATMIEAVSGVSITELAGGKRAHGAMHGGRNRLLLVEKDHQHQISI